MKMSSHDSHASPELPAVDERLVAPDSGYEIEDGRLVRVTPSHEPHADRNSKVAALLEAHVADDFNVAVDMLTRTSAIDDFAPDASVYPMARDPDTGGRQLEHLAFEVVNTETLADAGRKAAKLLARGVRRVFAIDVQRSRAFEWSRDLGTWRLLDSSATISDRALAVPLRIAVLVRAVKADDAVAAALLAKGNPVLVEAVAAGKAEGMAAAVLRVLDRRGIPVETGHRARILTERDLGVLDGWLDRALRCGAAAELFADDV